MVVLVLVVHLFNCLIVPFLPLSSFFHWLRVIDRISKLEGAALGEKRHQFAAGNGQIDRLSRARATLSIPFGHE